MTKKSDILKTVVAQFHAKATENETQAQQIRYKDRSKDASYHDGCAQGYRIAAAAAESRFSNKEPILQFLRDDADRRAKSAQQCRWSNRENDALYIDGVVQMLRQSAITLSEHKFA